MRISFDAWSIFGLALVFVGALLLFRGQAFGLPNALGLWVVIAGTATAWGRDGYGNHGSTGGRWFSKAMFWLAIAVLAINIFAAVA